MGARTFDPRHVVARVAGQGQQVYELGGIKAPPFLQRTG